MHVETVTTLHPATLLQDKEPSGRFFECCAGCANVTNVSSHVGIDKRSRNSTVEETAERREVERTGLTLKGVSSASFSTRREPHCDGVACKQEHNTRMCQRKRVFPCRSATLWHARTDRGWTTLQSAELDADGEILLQPR